jgi:hypothetical protein
MNDNDFSLQELECIGQFYLLALERMRQKTARGEDFSIALLETASERSRIHVTQESGVSPESRTSAVRHAKDYVLVFLMIELIKQKMNGIALDVAFIKNRNDAYIQLCKQLAVAIEESGNEAFQLYEKLVREGKVEYDGTPVSRGTDSMRLWITISFILETELAKLAENGGNFKKIARHEITFGVAQWSEKLVLEDKIAGKIKPEGTPESREADAINAAPKGICSHIGKYEGWLDALDKKVYIYDHAVRCEFGPGLVIPLEECQSREQIVRWGVEVVRAMWAHKAYSVPVERTIPHFVKLVRKDRPYSEVKILSAEIIAAGNIKASIDGLHRIVAFVAAHPEKPEYAHLTEAANKAIAELENGNIEGAKLLLVPYRAEMGQLVDYLRKADELSGPWMILYMNILK